MLHRHRCVILLGVGATGCYKPVQAYSTSRPSAMAPSLKDGPTGPTRSPVVRVASYNVLCDQLCEPEDFVHCQPEDCDSDTRFVRVQAQLEEQMEAGAVVCLQEVSRLWGAKLLPMLERHQYAYAAAASGTKFNGYMGQFMAWPRDKFEVVDVDVTRVSDTVQGVWPPWRTPPLSTWQKVKRFLRIGKPPKKPFDPWKETEKRHNTAVLARLRERETGATFVVGTYHMPCLFGSAAKCQVMVAHCSLLMQHAQRWAAEDPLVVCGDFNIAPGTPSYRLITTGSLPEDDEEFPPMPAPFNADWTPTVNPMRSAYKLRLGVEPDFTNKAWRSEDVFENCLDYIFISDGWRVRNVKGLPTSRSYSEVESLPTRSEPSDHLLIAADLEVPIK